MLDYQKGEIEKANAEVMANPQKVGLMEKLKGYIDLYERNLDTFQSQMDRVSSLFIKTKNTKFY